MRDAVSKGRHARGARLPHTKLDDAKKSEIVRMALAGVLYKEIAEKFGIVKQHAGQIAINNGVRRHGIGK
jgi:transposase-like protein